MAWFLSYLWKRPADANWQPADATTLDEHPVAYISRARHTYGAEGIEYRLLFFAEVPSEMATVVEPPVVRSTAGAIPRQPLDVR